MDPVIGIDLGTTYSAVATVEGGQPVIIPTRAGSRLTPSVVGFTPSGERVVGERARLLGDEAPERVAPATKRYIGRRWTPELANAAKLVVPYPLIAGPSGEVRIKVAGRILPLTQVSAMLLGELKLDAEAHFGRTVRKAVITVPANFDDGQRFATREAARIAGLDVLRIVNEPTAAAVAYGLTSAFEGRALVFDLGGGTFDVSILEVTRGVYEVKGTGGDTQLGGEDFDNRIVEWLLAQVPEGVREIVSKDRISMQRLKHAAESAKRTLTDQADALITLTELGDHSVESGTRFATLETNLTRDFFEQLSEPLSRRCVEVCEKVMKDAKLERSAIDSVLLVGGMTRVPLVRKFVTDFFGKEPVSGVNPDEVVALGAAVHSAELASQIGAALLIDVATHTLSVGVLSGTVRRLITKNTPVPAVAKEIFYPGRHGQTDVKIPVYQGESDYSDENARLGELVLSELSGIRRSDVPIEVTFELSAEGTLSARAVDTTTGMAEAIRIEARTTLQPHEVEQLQSEQRQYATLQGDRNKAAALDHFPRMLDKAERLAQLLQKGEDDAPPSAEAQNAVGNLQAVIAQGRAALKAEDLAQMAEVTRVLEKLFSAV